MASNDGARLTVFGLGYRQHDTRKMHRILDHYERLPENASDRVALYTTLTALARDIPGEEAQSIETWLSSGGEFPFKRDIRQPTLDRGRGFGGQGFGGDFDDEDEDEDMDDEDFGVGRHRPRHPPRGGHNVMPARGMIPRRGMPPRRAPGPPRPEMYMPRENNMGGGRTLGAPEGELDPIRANEPIQEN